MSHHAQQIPPVFHIDVSAAAPAPTPANVGMEIAILLRQLLHGQERSNQILAEVASQMTATFSRPKTMRAVTRKYCACRFRESRLSTTT